MAVYKDEDINVALINDKFPKVASAIIAQANEDAPALTAESFKAQYPDIAASFVADGKEAGVEAGKIEGAKAEAGRIADIEAVSMPGYESIVADAKTDGKSTAEDVKLAIFDAMQKNTADKKKAHAADGTTLAGLGEEIGGGEATELSDEDKAVALMDEAAKNAKGA